MKDERMGGQVELLWDVERLGNPPQPLLCAGV